MNPSCDRCGEDLHVNAVERPEIDWVKVVCSECGNIENVSMIRLASETRKR